MKAAVYKTYGPADVVHITDIARPDPKAGDILVRVGAAGVTTADWRLRAAAFPGLISKLAGRMMFGLFAPRNAVLGSDYAGEVVAVGTGVTGFRPGDRVFGFAWGGAHAEYIAVKAEGAVLATPAGLTDTQAAAIPFGAQAALEFLDRFAQVKPGERVLIVGASGGVGAYAVQIAKALGAHVTGVASGANRALVEGLGADAFVDYRKSDPAALTGPFDVVLETIGVMEYRTAAPMLADGGRFVPLNFGLGDVLAARKARRSGHTLILKVNGDSKAGLKRLSDMIEAGRLRPVIDRVYPFDQIHAAYAHVESRRRKGAVVLKLPEAEDIVQAA
ncbi:alcohol dehydrogenase, zinc-containing [Roseibacterium elongatum DSM 19469]|uniref:Alcohol dehydrogenase, zinc-containing n=1 Tax=Roseicyclus elongatus DSM 19469 TaxID=1294273 RepID=W8RSH8_9RHOB|nr:NAD(P)-dependent alcohol dehydrogenase [Roseibacterium elongatum]AHM04068.1 alcohol dehydrogenase, zinc-containing [Roseibacterium elongatum DSM 19469]